MSTNSSHKLPEYMSVFGTAEDAELSGFTIEKNGEEAPLFIACYPPAKDKKYYTYATVLNGKTLLSLHSEVTEDCLFELCICSPEEDENIEIDMVNFVNFVIQNGYIIDETNQIFGLPRDNDEEVHYLSLSSDKTAVKVGYDNMTVPVFTFFRIFSDERKWMADVNKKWQHLLGAKIFREALEYKALLPAGGTNRSPLTGDKTLIDTMDRLASDIGPKLEARGSVEWGAVNPDLAYTSMLQSFLKRNFQGTIDEKIQEAGMLMTSGKFDEAIAMYKQMIEDDPKDKYLMMNQIGAALFFKEDYQGAMDHYIPAVQNGIDSADYNLWEVCDLLYKQEKDKKYLNIYLNHCPDGEFSDQVKKQLK